MLAAAIINAQEKELVYDLCSGIGENYASGRMDENQGQIYAAILQPKLSLLKDNCQRLGITIVKTIAADIMELELI